MCSNWKHETQRNNYNIITRVSNIVIVEYDFHIAASIEPEGKN